MNTFCCKGFWVGAWDVTYCEHDEQAQAERSWSPTRTSRNSKSTASCWMARPWHSTHRTHCKHCVLKMFEFGFKMFQGFRPQCSWNWWHFASWSRCTSPDPVALECPCENGPRSRREVSTAWVNACQLQQAAKHWKKLERWGPAQSCYLSSPTMTALACLEPHSLPVFCFTVSWSCPHDGARHCWSSWQFIKWYIAGLTSLDMFWQPAGKSLALALQKVHYV